MAKPPFGGAGQAPSIHPPSQRSRGMRSMPRRSGIHSVIVVIEVAAPFTLVLNGGAAVFSQSMVL
jgi:hypothetical protein